MKKPDVIKTRENILTGHEEKKPRRDPDEQFV